MPGSIIAIGDLKGGFGKTVMAVNLACALAVHGRRVILVDADEQGTASKWGHADRLPVILKTMPPLSGTPRDLNIWTTTITALKTEADIVVLDLPKLGTTTVAALSAADVFILVATQSTVDLDAAKRAVGLLRQVRIERKDGKPLCLLVPFGVDRWTFAGRKFKAILSEFGEPVGPAIAQHAAHADAFTVGMWIGEFAPRSPGAEIECLTDLVIRSAEPLAQASREWRPRDQL